MMIRKCVALTVRFGIVPLVLITTVNNMKNTAKWYTHCGWLPGHMGLLFKDK